MISVARPVKGVGPSTLIELVQENEVWVGRKWNLRPRRKVPERTFYPLCAVEGIHTPVVRGIGVKQAGIKC